MVWLTHNDAELIGSNSPIVIDEEKLEQRIKVPEVQQDLDPVKMGLAEDFLSYFVMGNEGVKAYSMGGRINTDDNLYLEFSAPHSMGKMSLMGSNVDNLVKYRESIIPYMVTPADEADRERQKITWGKNMKAAILDDQAHVLNLAGRFDTPEYQKLMIELDTHYPTYAPWRFLRNEIHDEKGGTSRLLKQTEFSLVNEKNEIIKVQFSAVIIRSSDERARVFFVDSNSRVVFGTLRVRGANRDAYVATFADDVLKSVQALYNEERKITVASGKAYPSATSLLPKIRYLVELKVDREKI
jgi:spermidine synthase